MHLPAIPSPGNHISVKYLGTLALGIWVLGSQGKERGRGLLNWPCRKTGLNRLTNKNQLSSEIVISDKSTGHMSVGRGIRMTKGRVGTAGHLKTNTMKHNGWKHDPPGIQLIVFLRSKGKKGMFVQEGCSWSLHQGRAKPEPGLAHKLWYDTISERNRLQTTSSDEVDPKEPVNL